MGLPITIEDYILGLFWLVLLLVLIIGPIYFFSEFSNFSVFNPVLSSSINIAIIVNKTLSVKNLTERMVPEEGKLPLNDPIVYSDPLEIEETW